MYISHLYSTGHWDPHGNYLCPFTGRPFLYSYEAEFIQTLIKSGKQHLAKSFHYTYKYIDDVLSINNPKFGNYIVDIYPAELEIKDTTDADHRASYLDLDLSYDRYTRLQVKLYDKRDDFTLNIANFPFLISNIPQSPAYGVYVSQLIRYARASSAYSDFLVRSRLLTRKWLGQGYNRFKLITTFKKFYGRHYHLIGKFQLSVTNMVTALFLETLFLRVAGPFTARPLITQLTLCTCAFYSQCTFYWTWHLPILTYS